jgi:hypothetical protein
LQYRGDALHAITVDAHIHEQHNIKTWNHQLELSQIHAVTDSSLWQLRICAHNHNELRIWFQDMCNMSRSYDWPHNQQWSLHESKMSLLPHITHRDKFMHEQNSSPTDTASIYSDDRGRIHRCCWKLNNCSIHERMQMLSATMFPKNCEALIDRSHGGRNHCPKTQKDCKKVRENKT